MKGFFKFLIFSLLLIAGFILYYIYHPSNGMIVRQGAKWIILEHNVSKK